MVSTKELYERYKQLKAEGKNVSISELRAQMESESANISSVTSVEGNTPIQAESNTTQNYIGIQSTQNSLFSQASTQSYISPQELTPTPITPSAPIQNNYEKVSVQNYNTIVSGQNNTNTVEEPKTKKFALIGYPLGHSLSYYIHDAGFKSLGIDASYDILETPPEKLVDRIKFLKSNGYSGFNVTIPLKLPITMFLDEIDLSADVVNAVNTVKIDPETKALKGYNTDEAGFRNAIPKDITLCGEIGGILGTGGAARAAVTAMARAQMKEIRFYTRNVLNAVDLLEYSRKTFPNVEFNAFQINRLRDLSDVSFLVNATPIGMQGYSADLSPVEDPELRTLPPNAVIYDVIYNPKKTKLIKMAQSYNYRTITGMDMLIYQALEAEKIWTGMTPDFKDMKIAALENL